jgi:hypothetical protein
VKRPELVGDMRLTPKEIPTGNRRPHHTEEVMTNESGHTLISRREGIVKTLAIRLEEEQHAQLTIIAQLEELTVTDAIRQAIEQWVEARRNNPQLKARAQAVLDEIEQEATTRKGAIAALLSDQPSGGTRRSSRRGGDES